MKYLVAYLILIGLSQPIKSFGQCEADKIVSGCVDRLAEGFTFLKSYKLQDTKSAEYSYVFTKGTKYVLNLCEPGGSAENMVVTLYDSNRKKIASNQIGDKKLPAIGYACAATGLFYFTFEFANSSEPCGVSVLGFKRQ